MRLAAGMAGPREAVALFEAGEPVAERARELALGHGADAPWIRKDSPANGTFAGIPRRMTGS